MYPHETRRWSGASGRLIDGVTVGAPIIRDADFLPDVHALKAESTIASGITFMYRINDVAAALDIAELLPSGKVGFVVPAVRATLRTHHDTEYRTSFRRKSLQNRLVDLEGGVARTILLLA